MSKYSKRKDGRFQTRVFLGRDDSTGKKIFKYLYAPTVKELKELETEARTMYGKGIDLLALEDTLEDWAERFYNVKKIQIEYKDFVTYKYRCEYFLSRLGDIPLKDIRQTHLQQIINELYAHNPTTGKQTSKKTLVMYLSAISAVFEYAIENRVSDFNPCKYVKIPKKAPVKTRRALSRQERRWIEETPHRAQTAAMLMLYSGLRRGEAAALLWSDVNLEEKTITVTKSYNFKDCTLKDPKTAAGTRVVSIPQKLVDYLSNVPKTGIHVVTRPDGKMMSTDSAWRRMWHSYLDNLNEEHGANQNGAFPTYWGNVMTIEPFTPHCLRHTFCTMMYEAGIDVLTAKEQMGHSDVKTTISIYTHLDSTHKMKNITKLDDYLTACS